MEDRDLKNAGSVGDQNTQTALVERIKELSCLYGIARIAADTNKSLDRVIENIVELLPAAWLHSDKAFALIVLDDRSYPTLNYQRSNHRQQAPIVIDGRQRGYVEVGYPKTKIEPNRALFLDEERALLDTVAKEIVSIVVRRETEQDKLALEGQLRHADRLATIGQLAAGVAHELNEPLGHILGFAQLAQKCPGLPPQVQADLDRILSTSLYAREIVKKLLIFSRQMPPQKTKVNLNHLVRNAVSFLQSQCLNDGIAVECLLSPKLPEIDADPSQLNQVVVNLVVNAMQAMPDGGRLNISTVRDRGKVCLIVEDTGIGMDDMILQKIFTPFFTTKDVGLGTGLGLPVVHGIVTSHGGSIKVESEVGKGTRFRIQLPIRKDRML